MSFRTAAPVIVLVALFAACATARAVEIGSAQMAKDQVEGVVDGQTQNISSGTKVFSNELVRTGDSGVANLMFLDRTNLNVGPTSQVRLDEFVYDPTGAHSSVVLNATKGAFRLVTGSQDKSAYQVTTPFGTLGVRGTIVEMLVNQCRPGERPIVTKGGTGCGVTIRVVEGSAYFTTTNGQVIELTPNTVTTINSLGEVSQVVSTESILPAVQLATLEPATLVPTGAILAGLGAVGGVTGAIIATTTIRPASP